MAIRFPFKGPFVGDQQASKDTLQPIVFPRSQKPDGRKAVDANRIAQLESGVVFL